MDEDLSITTGPPAADLTVEDLEQIAWRLVRAADDTGETAQAVAILQAHPLLVSGAMAGPGSAVTLGLAEVALAATTTQAVAQSLGLRELGVRTLVVIEARRVVEQVVEASVDAQAAAVAVLLLTNLPTVVVVGVAVQAQGVPLLAGVQALAFARPGTVEFLAEGVGPLLPILIGGARLVSLGSVLTEKGHVVVLARPARPSGPPRGLGDLVGAGEDLGVGDDATVRVTQVRRGGSSAWIVQVPGTQSWPPRGGPNPHDLTTNALLVSDRTALVASGVAQALDAAQAQAGPGSQGPVMLVGHSQGGMIAAALAASPSFRSTHRVTHVVTYGAPISSAAIPAGVSVLAMQHQQDAVPRLDGAPDPERAGWVTVTRDLGDDDDVRGDLLAAHSLTEYAETARAADQDRGAAMTTWRRGAEDFLPPPEQPGDPGDPTGAADPIDPTGAADPTERTDAVDRDYTLRRVPDPSPHRRAGGTW